MTNELVVKVIWEGKEEEVVLGEISWKQKKDAMRKSMREVMRGRNIKKEADPVAQKEFMMLSSIRKAPFEATPENFDKLSGRDVEKIFAAYAKLNEYDEEEESGEQ